jgi:hypothetical protein
MQPPADYREGRRSVRSGTVWKVFLKLRTCAAGWLAMGRVTLLKAKKTGWIISLFLE